MAVDKSTRKPTISAIVPCYGYGKYLEQCVDSILAQKEVDVDILIIDDASTDDSLEIAERISAKCARVEVRRHLTNIGHIDTYNEGLLEWARGDYSILISADDVLVEGALARAASVMQQYPNVGLVYGHAINWVDDKPLPAARTVPSSIKVWRGHDWIRRVCKLGHNVITSPEVVVRTRAQQEVGGYRRDLPHSGDLEMWLRFAARHDVAFIEGADQAYYRIHSNNMTVSRSPVIDLRQRAKAFDSFFEDSGRLLDNAHKLQRAAQRKIAKEALWRACRAYDRRRLQQTPVSELKQFAQETFTEADGLPEAFGLRWREWVGPGVPPYLQPFMFSAIHRRLRTILWWRRWRRKGV